jgi:hypothetical protein
MQVPVARFCNRTPPLPMPLWVQSVADGYPLHPTGVTTTLLPKAARHRWVAELT